MNGQVIPGWQAIKTDSVALDSFCAYPGGPVGRIVGESLIAIGGHVSSPIAGRFHDVLQNEMELPIVDIVVLRGGCGDRPLSNGTRRDCKGLVIAGFGAGTMPDSLADLATEMSRSGSVVVISSRVGRVAVLSGTMSPDEDDGLIPSGFLNPQKSALILSLALAGGLEVSEIARFFQRFSVESF